jgi:hypothetical protein
VGRLRAEPSQSAKLGSPRTDKLKAPRYPPLSDEQFPGVLGLFLRAFSSSSEHFSPLFPQLVLLVLHLPCAVCILFAGRVDEGRQHRERVVRRARRRDLVLVLLMWGGREGEGASGHGDAGGRSEPRSSQQSSRAQHRGRAELQVYE